MKRNKIRYDRWLRTLFLSFALLTGGGGWMVWGQTTGTDRTIQLQYSTDNGYHKHDSVFVETKEIYVVPGRERELFIPELRISIATKYSNNDRYNWYVHWYVQSNNSLKGTIGFKQFTTTKDEAALQGGDWVRGDGENSYTTTDYFVTNTGKDGGLVWSKRLKNHFKDQGGYGMDASTIIYTAPDGYQEGDIVYCDVSTYQDGSLDKNGVYIEPTLTKRTKYIIKHYNKYQDLKPATYYYPAIRNAMNYDETGSLTGGNPNRTINFSMPSLPNNYFWENGEQIVQGEYFQYKVEGVTNEYKKFHLTTRKGADGNDISLNLQQTQRIPREIYDQAKNEGIKDLVVSVQVASDKASNPKNITTYTFSPVEDMGFEIEDNIKDDNSRYPRRNGDRYELIGSVDFDLGEPITSLTEQQNIATEPFGSFKENQTTYGFWNKTIYPLLRTNYNGKTQFFSTSNQNMYGLFRSASQFKGSINQTDTYGEWEYQYYFPVLLSTDKEMFNDVIFYDRTYYISQDKSDPVNAGQESLQTKYGHFYYVDASNEPGTVVNVPINGTICSNTEITVTAWLADMTRANWIPGLKDYPLAPNLNILFKGKTGDTEEILHRFTTGDALVNYSNKGSGEAKYNSYLMQWQQLYYTFVLDKDVNYEKYYLEIQNNEPHTDGADYAIDDIRIFRTIPKVSLVQADDPCDLGTNIAKVKFVTDYDLLLRNMGLKRGDPINESRVDLTTPPPYEDQTAKLLQDYINKNPGVQTSDYKKIMYMIYDPNRENGKKFPLRLKYNGKDETYFRIFYLATDPEKMEWTGNFKYDKNNYKSGEDIMITSTTITLKDGLLEGDKDYIARVFVRNVELLEKYEAHLNGTTILTNDEIEEVKRLYSLEDNTCALTGSFKIIPVKDFLEIKQGETSVDYPTKMEKGKEYTLTGHLFYYPENENQPKELPDAVFNWFLGPQEEFVAPNAITVGEQSYSIQSALENYHTDNTLKEGIENALNEKYGIAESSNQKVTLSSDKRIALEVSSITYTMTSEFQPISIYTPSQQGNKILENDRYCSDSRFIDLGVAPPPIEPGDPDTPNPPEDPKDPEDPDKPQPDDWYGKHVRSVRVMLTQIQDMQQNQGKLRIPIYKRGDTDDKIQANTFCPRGAEDENAITVCKTSDTERKNSLLNKRVATLKTLVDSKEKPEWGSNYFQIEFNDLAVDENSGFREGFWYMVDIPYAVKNEKDQIYSTGSMKLTLKIVPEYVTWVGSESGMHNWNNDGPKHWRRSNDAELYTTDVASANGTHNEAYTPMRFTKVTVVGNKDGKAYSAYPYLYELKKNTGSQEKDPNNVLLHMDVPTNLTTENIGAATKNIEYDLLADPDYERELFGSVTNPDKLTTGNNHNYACVRFYGNACDEIYIKPESEILHTEFLTYNKAHVDYEMAPNRWYMLASPLKDVVSGDMYLPKKTGSINNKARQETPAFENISYNENYTRWDPAVYMRGWNNSSVSLIRPGDNATFNYYGTKANWSNLYNDVTVAFTPGTGFSIGTKTSLDKTEKVLFRLPKNDKEYSYFGSGDTSGEEDDKKEINRTDNGRFYFSDRDKDGNETKETSCEVTGTSGMFGNPFMSHLDMNKFFNNGTGVYHILTQNGTSTSIIGDKYELTTGDADPNYVAPLQSFIVPNLASATFNTDMIAKAPTTGKPGLRSATVAPAEEPLPQLRITATRNGVRNTAVVAGLATASDSYVEGEDAALLINEEVAAPQVYTLAGNQMVAINVTPDLAEIPVGIHGKDATSVELSFKLSGAMKNVKLVDKQTGKRYDVTDGLTLTVPGNTYGRYFLNGSIATSNEIIARNHIIFYNSAPGRIDVSSVDALSEVTVYDIAGRALRTLRNLNTPTASVDHLAPGIYVVRAESGSQTVSEKVEVK